MTRKTNTKTAKSGSRPSKTAKARPYKTGIVLPDIHVPKHDAETLAAVEAFIGDTYLDYYINLGDFMDWPFLHVKTKEKLREVEGERLMSHYDVANEILDRHVKACRRKNPNCEMVILEGNHDYRIEVLIDANPVLEGLFEPERILEFARRGIKYVKSHSKNELFNVGKAFFHHGLYTNKYHAAKMASVFDVPIFYGHLHDTQEYSEIKQGADKTIAAQSLGCLCKYEQDYLRGRPTRWQQAFGFFWFFPDGYFQHAVIKIFKNKFVGPTNGKLYDGKEIWRTARSTTK
jgi:hypothetical protein